MFVTAQIEKPTIEYKELYGEYYGVVTPESLDGWNNDHYEYEAIDENGNPVDITIASEAGYARFYVPSAGTKVRVRIPASGYWLESEWSEWVTFDGIKVAAPTLGEYSTTNCTISWSLDNIENISHYVYTINGGEEVTVALDGTLSVFLNNGDVFRVKCVPTTNAIANGYVDSAWVTYVCTDSRTALSTPANVRFDVDTGYIIWDAVDGANYYILEITYEGWTDTITYRKTSYWGGKPGAIYRVRAAAEDTENYRLSDWSESVIDTSE